MAFTTLLIETHDRVGVITLNRPEALNALCHKLIQELNQALDGFEEDDSIHVIVLMGSERAFAAGADIKEMQAKTYQSAYSEDFITKDWERISHCRKPVIAAVSGYALGGGCEIAMMCDMIIAADNAKFGQPEVTIGTIPGAGGTQRLTRLIGKAKAMDMCLTGRVMDAEEAERSGLISRVVPLDKLKEETLAMAQTIASYSLPITMMAKEAINQAMESTLTSGLKFERRLFHSTFAFEDRAEGMAAFLEKRKPKFKDK